MDRNTYIMNFDGGRPPLKDSDPYAPFYMGPTSFFFKILPKIWSQITSKEVRSWIATHISCILMGESPPQSFGPICPFLRGANLILHFFLSCMYSEFALLSVCQDFRTQGTQPTSLLLNQCSGYGFEKL